MAHQGDVPGMMEELVNVGQRRGATNGGGVDRTVDESDQIQAYSCPQNPRGPLAKFALSQHFP